MKTVAPASRSVAATPVWSESEWVSTTASTSSTRWPSSCRSRSSPLVNAGRPASIAVNFSPSSTRYQLTTGWPSRCTFGTTWAWITAMGRGSLVTLWLLRVDVDREGGATMRPVGGGALHRPADGADGGRAVGRLDHDLRPFAVANAEQRRGAEHDQIGPLGPLGPTDRRRHGAGGAHCGARALGGAHDADELGGRRVGQGRATLELARHEPLGVLAGGVADGWGVGVERLHEHAAAARPAPGAAGELGD